MIIFPTLKVSCTNRHSHCLYIIAGLVTSYGALLHFQLQPYCLKNKAHFRSGLRPVYFVSLLSKITIHLHPGSHSDYLFHRRIIQQFFWKLPVVWSEMK